MCIHTIKSYASLFSCLCMCICVRLSRDQNGFPPKGLKAHNAELGIVCAWFLNGPQMKDPLSGESGGPPPEICWLLQSQLVHSSAIFGSLYSNSPTPSPSKNFLFRFTLISRMVLGVWKKSEIRLKSENFDPCWVSILWKIASQKSLWSI